MRNVARYSKLPVPYHTYHTISKQAFDRRDIRNNFWWVSIVAWQQEFNAWEFCTILARSRRKFMNSQTQTANYLSTLEHFGFVSCRQQLKVSKDLSMSFPLGNRFSRVRMQSWGKNCTWTCFIAGYSSWGFFSSFSQAWLIHCTS
jgi:hypothetical protein